MGSTGVPTKVTLGIISSSVAATDGLHYWRAGRLTATPGRTFRSHVTLLTNPVTDIPTARVVPYTTSDQSEPANN